jgi:hypothetical protein
MEQTAATLIPHTEHHGDDDTNLRRACARFVAKVESLVARPESVSDFTKRKELFEALKLAAEQSGLRGIPKHLSAKLGERFETVRAMYLTFYQELEYRAAQKILANKTSLESVFRSHNHDLLKQEIQSTGMGKGSVVGFVGCGCLPWSAIALHELVGAEVVGFDRDQALVQIAAKVVEALGGKGGVRVSGSEGEHIDYRPFSHVYLAGMCDQKLSVIRQVSAALAPGSTLLIRSGRSPYECFYLPFLERTLPGFAFAGTASSRGVDELETLIFEKMS